MSLEGSDVQILVTAPGGSPVDITNGTVIASAEFGVSSGATPETATIRMRDPDQLLSFVTGSRLKLLVDDQPLWAGYLMRVGRGNFFPAGDARATTKTRSFSLMCVDSNILMDRRFFRRTTNYLSAPPNITASTMDGAIIRTALSTYFDMPSWLDLSSEIDDVIDVITGQGTKGWAWPEQGSKLRFLFESLSAYLSGAVYYIGPDDKVHYHAIQDTEAPWGFSDKPNHAPITGAGGFEGAYWGFKELNADEDGSEFATDAFVWGGSPFAGTGTTVFKRATDTDLEDIHDKWQRAETHFNETNFKTQATVDQRANIIVFGNPDGDPSGAAPGSVVGEGPRGLRFPQWSYSFTWHSRDVPSIAGVPRHLYPGDIVPIQLWAFSEDSGATPFSKFLPLRNLKISFPSGAQDGKAHVRFTGLFDLRNEDPFTLWKYLRQREPVIESTPIDVTTNDSTSTSYGATYQGEPSPVPDDSTTVFTLPFGYIDGTLMVYSGTGRLLRLGVDYTESDPVAGEFTMTVAPPSGEGPLYVTARMLDAAPPTSGAFAGSSLQSAIDAAADGTTLYLNQNVLSGGQINILNRNGLVIDGQGFTLTIGSYAPAFYLSCCTNITIRNMIIVGAHPDPGVYYAGTEDAHGVSIGGGTGLIFSNLDIRNTQGDGFYIAQCGTSWADGVTIADCRVADNGRMGIAVVAGRNITADRMTYHNIAFHIIDLEPDWNPSYQQGATDLRFSTATSDGWVGKFPSGLVDATAFYFGLPYGPIGGYFQPTIARVQIDGHHIIDGITGIRTQFDGDGFRIEDVLMTDNEGDQEVQGIGSGNAYVNGQGADDFTFTNNVQPVPAGSYAVDLSDSTGLVVTGNTGAGLIGQIKP